MLPAVPRFCKVEFLHNCSTCSLRTSWDPPPIGSCTKKPALSRRSSLSTDASLSGEILTRLHDAEHVETDQLGENFDTLAALLASECRVSAGATSLGRGLILTENLDRGSTVLSIDRANLLCLADMPGSASSFAKEAISEWQILHGQMPPLLVNFLLTGGPTWFNRMVAWLLWLSANGSPIWKLYTRLLPKESDMTCLMNYRSNEVVELQNPSLEALARKEHESIMALHERMFHSVNGDLRGLGLANDMVDTLWAASCVNSRVFSEVVDDVSFSLMVPCADMANHSFSPSAGYEYSTPHNAFQLTARKDASAGGELCISYGCVTKDNDQMMKDYGFVLPGNKNDRIPFFGGQVGSPVAPPGELPYVRPTIHAQHLFSALGLQGALTANGVTLTHIPGTRRIPSAPVAGDSIRNVREREKCVVQSLRPFLRDGGGDVVEGRALEAEKRTVEWLQQQCVDMLNSCGTSIESDLELLLPGSTLSLSARHSAAVMARLERKRLLSTGVSVLQEYINFLRAKFS